MPEYLDNFSIITKRRYSSELTSYRISRDSPGSALNRPCFRRDIPLLLLTFAILAFFAGCASTENNKNLLGCNRHEYGAIYIVLSDVLSWSRSLFDSESRLRLEVERLCSLPAIILSARSASVWHQSTPIAVATYVVNQP